MADELTADEYARLPAPDETRLRALRALDEAHRLRDVADVEHPYDEELERFHGDD